MSDERQRGTGSGFLARRQRLRWGLRAPEPSGLLTGRAPPAGAGPVCSPSGLSAWRRLVRSVLFCKNSARVMRNQAQHVFVDCVALGLPVSRGLLVG